MSDPTDDRKRRAAFLTIAMFASLGATFVAAYLIFSNPVAGWRERGPEIRLGMTPEEVHSIKGWSHGFYFSLGEREEQFGNQLFVFRIDDKGELRLHRVETSSD